jgi:hypothetical protein
MEIDFTNARNRKALEAATDLIHAGYRILRDEIGADKPSDNAFLREAQVCAIANLIWVSDRGGADGRTHAGDDVEIKSTRLDHRSVLQFPTSRYVSPTVIIRFREATFWLFAIFDVYEELVAVYRVEAADMEPIIDRLEARMNQRAAEDGVLENNPKIGFSAIFPIAEPVFLHREFEVIEQRPGVWTIKRREPPVA